MAIIDYRESRADEQLADGQILDFGKTKLRVVHTPGHSPGHCCFYEEKTGIMIGGDIDLTPFGPWYGHARSDLDDFELSMEKLLAFDVYLFLSGHGEAIVAGNVAARLSSYAAMFKERDIKILKALEKPANHTGLAEKVRLYSRYPEPQFFFKYLEENMLKKHLNRMIKQQLISVIGESYVINKTV